MLRLIHASQLGYLLWQQLQIFGSRPSDHYFRSVCWFVCLFVCLCRVFLSPLWSDFDRTYVICLDLVVSPRIGAVRPLWAGWPLKLVFLEVWGLKNYLALEFWSVVLIFGYIVKRSNTIILSSHFFAISILNPNYDVINDVISGFAKVVVERCGFHHSIAQRISWDEVVSVFLYLL